LSIESGVPLGDPLMRNPMSFEQVKFWDDDKDKNAPIMLALTSD
jgi:hypothetical protein